MSETGPRAIEFDRVGVSYPSTWEPSLKEAVVGLFRRRPRRNPFWALRSVSFGVSPGEAIGIVGENGAGKSTLLRVAAGIIPPIAGEVVVRGSVAPLIELGTGFDVELTGRENVFFNGALLGRSRSQMLERVPEIIEFSGLHESIDAPLRTYSTGMVARLAFSIATSVDADIVLLDEILSVGDAAFRDRCEGRIRRYYESGATVLLVSHDLKSIRDLCPRSVWVREGRIFADGPSEEVVDEYLAFLRGGRPLVTVAPADGLTITPSSARPGATVTIRGEALGDGVRVRIGGVDAPARRGDERELLATVPELQPGGHFDLAVIEGERVQRRTAALFVDYEDLEPGSPCHAAVVRLASRGVLHPTGSARFGAGLPLTWEELRSILPEAAPLAARPERPDEAMTRAGIAPVFVAVRHGMDFVPPPSEGIFEDVPPEETNARYVEQLYRDRIAAGISRKPMLFGASKPVTRCQFAVLLDLALGLG